MREIKFRAWNKKKCGFIAGFNMFNYHGYYNANIQRTIKRYGTEWKEDEYILTQYIDLKDRNGVEIYEGDVIGFYRKHDAIRFEVTYQDGMFTGKYIPKGCIIAKQRLQECSKDGISYNGLPANLIHGGRGNPWEVIGNIYQNPELLEDKQ